MYMQKRDNMGFQIAPALIIFLVILGAGFLICCGFAVYRSYHAAEDDPSWSARSPEQDAYMREVRERNWGRFSKPGGQNLAGPSFNRNMAHAPMSPR
ncbi:uncharacterized protein K460DRAFT_286883 [Cucurbitaria berberidis CBS 394.84]|uniref:Uncharacterized protein n=1 Tax=Cucurbitaria berberidis CBS 394.84 TaxID=1168544 RepID=A0A9P4GFB5_9PLEO|nr:uncharacterized protein K460DRAFT_286883 [Cucurbitaria berberidis CBS 394.84]KAF1844135.1 hypothetical protein K460DRAFT_286883 [Cucurbitaria berberidis CBS 394.84]